MKDEATEEKPAIEQSNTEETNGQTQENGVENGQTNAVDTEDQTTNEEGENIVSEAADTPANDNEEVKKSEDTPTSEPDETQTMEETSVIDNIEAKTVEDPSSNGKNDEINANKNEIINDEQDSKKSTADGEAEEVIPLEKDPSETLEMIDEKTEVEFRRERRLTAYERLSNDLSGDHKVQKEITLGKRIGFYRIRGELGSGNFSQVKMGIHALTKEKVAVKILDKTKLDGKTQRLLSREISSMEKMHHPNIIRLYEVVETLAKLHIVMEYAGGGELFNKITNEGKIAEPEAKIVYAQVLAALEHMHEKNIIHRDIKAENVFYAGPRFVKVGDFGFSTFSRSDQTLDTFCGSPPYAAPELFKDEHYFGTFVDIWAMGILLYFMVCGVMPFRAETVSKLKKCILQGTFTIPTFVSDSCQFLIRGILKPIPQDRFTLMEIQKSDWLEGQEFPEGLPPYNLNPSGDGAELTEEEIEARSILHDLGISEEHIKACHGKDSRSSINGTYRIVLHKVQRRRSGRVIDPGPDFEADLTVTDGKDNKNPRSTKKASKFCVIL